MTIDPEHRQDEPAKLTGWLPGPTRQEFEKLKARVDAMTNDQPVTRAEFIYALDRITTALDYVQCRMPKSGCAAQNVANLIRELESMIRRPATAPDGDEADTTHPQYQKGWAAAWEANTIAERDGGDDEAERIHDLWTSRIDDLRKALGIPDGAIGYDPGETAEETIGSIVGQLQSILTDPGHGDAVLTIDDGINVLCAESARRPPIDPNEPLSDMSSYNHGFEAGYARAITDLRAAARLEAEGRRDDRPA